jgi:hypothetical protein
VGLWPKLATCYFFSKFLPTYLYYKNHPINPTNFRPKISACLGGKS